MSALRSQLRSKDIGDYFATEFAGLKARVPLPCPIHLYFAQNNHVIVWRSTGEVPSPEFLEGYGAKGITQVWIHQDDKELFLSYLRSEDHPWNTSELVSEESAKRSPEDSTNSSRENIPQPEAKTFEGDYLTRMLTSPALSPAQKEAYAKIAAEELIQQSLRATTPEEQRFYNYRSRRVVGDLLALTAKGLEPSTQDIWKMANVDAELEHAVNVATYTVIFTLAFGELDPDLLSDLALAGLLHDLGLCKIPARLAQTTWDKMSAQALEDYSHHVERSIELIQTHAVQTAPRVLEVLKQHHERHDGQGYPAHLSGPGFDDLAQLLALADLADSTCCGRFDGQSRTLAVALEMICTQEKEASQPQRFSNEILNLVVEWLTSRKAESAAARAVRVVENQVRSLVTGKPDLSQAA